MIHTSNLSKLYRIQDIERIPTSLLNKLFGSNKRDFWALKEVNFEVEEGQFVGLLGSNGSGKSTLLKLLAEITAPSAGEIRLQGKVSSVLEVGVGFHSELSGKENIYLNGSLLGMTKKEIDRQIDAIVAFAEVEEFLEVPIKRYSTGMKVRMAFAVASHLRTEIMLVDEVLAVGDRTFKRQAIKRMLEMTREGSTILIVSHDMEMLQKMCTHGIFLKNGELQASGTFEEALSLYETY